MVASPIDGGKNMKIGKVKMLHHLCDRCRHQNRLLNSKQDKEDPFKLKCHHVKTQGKWNENYGHLNWWGCSNCEIANYGPAVCYGCHDLICRNK